MTAFLRNPLTFLPPVRFNMNQVSEVADAPALEQTADLLLKHRSLQVEIGSYLHTGSRNVKGIAMSLKRSRAVKALLIQYGVAANRITIASPEYNGSLMNTCSAVTDCGHESAMLNGMVEFKITGTSQ